MKTRQRAYATDILSRERLRSKLQGVFESYQGSPDHVSVFCVPVRLKNNKDLLACLSNQKGIFPEDIEVCLVFENEEECEKSNGEIFIKPENWGLVGGGVDIIDIFNIEGVEELTLTKKQKNLIVRELLSDVGVEELLTIIESALYREAREEAGLTITPFWGLCRVDPKEDDDGNVIIAVTVLAEIRDMSDTIDAEEIKEKRFFAPLKIVENIKEAKATSVTWMYKSHIRRFGTMMSFLGTAFEGISSALKYVFDKR